MTLTNENYMAVGEIANKIKIIKVIIRYEYYLGVLNTEEFHLRKVLFQQCTDRIN